ncbi:MAG: MBL fold metallo-hydrolase [Myxococcota bacterium]|nr:MBL fold metallo-hydrolase [Myxococcota bacterium]MEE2779813.1 MBL fold metallo-hydrolase [Myxococcota bacterium]
MKLKFWGTRGSIATPSLETRELGGNTTCVEVSYGEGRSLVIDCGTGVIEYASRGVNLRENSEFHFLITHFHWDHIIGFPFFHPIHVPGTRVNFYSPFSEEECRANITMLFDGTYSPLRDMANLNADVQFHSLSDDGGCEVNGLQLEACTTTHSATCYAYRLKGPGVDLGFVTDHERQADLEQNQRVVDLVKGCQVLVHEAHYTANEYKKRRGWGHCTIEDAITNATAAGTSHLLLHHHAPDHTDDFLRLYMRRLRQNGAVPDNAPESIRLAVQNHVYEY